MPIGKRSRCCTQSAPPCSKARVVRHDRRAPPERESRHPLSQNITMPSPEGTSILSPITVATQQESLEPRSSISRLDTSRSTFWQSSMGFSGVRRQQAPRNAPSRLWNECERHHPRVWNAGAMHTGDGQQVISQYRVPTVSTHGLMRQAACPECGHQPAAYRCSASSRSKGAGRSEWGAPSRSHG